MLSGQCETPQFFSSLKQIWILSYWLCSPANIFGRSLLYLDSSIGMNRWDLEFQRLMRIIFYLFNSVNLNSQEYLKIQRRYLSLIVSYLSVNSTIFSERQGPAISSTDQLRFVLTILHEFYQNKYGNSPTTSTFAKCILRTYILCISLDEKIRDDYLITFMEYFPLVQWPDTGTPLNEDTGRDVHLNPHTFHALLIINFDIRRRLSPQQLLRYDTNNKIWTVDSSHNFITKKINEPFPEKEQQLEKLRTYIIYGFHNPSTKSTLSTTVSALQPGILNRVKNSPELLFNEISVSIQTCLTTNNIKRLILWIKVLGSLTCLESHLNVKRESLEHWTICTMCDSTGSGLSFSKIDSDRHSASTHSHAYQLLKKYFLNNASLEWNESVVAGILFCLQRIFIHFKPPDLVLDSNSSNVLFNFMNKCFTDRSRYIRLISTRLVPLWNINDMNYGTDQHTASLVKFLQNNNRETSIETWTMGWAQLVCTTSGDLFDTLLLKLIDIFNSEDYALQIMITFQIKKLAAQLKKTPYTLLSPILPILLRQLGKSLSVKKYAFQRLNTLLGYSAKTILEMFQRYIVPYAIMQYKEDVFSELASIMCERDPKLLERQKLSLLEKNSRQIFAVALVRHGLFSVETLETLFLNRLPSFDKRYISSYLPDYKTLAEVIKLYKNNEEDDASGSGNKNSVLFSLRFLITNFERDKRHGTKYKLASEWSETQEAQFQKRLQDNVLGIFQVFSSDIHDIEGRTTSYEKLRVVNGICFLIKYASHKSIISALAQISICLQTGLEIKEVRYNAFKCWYLLIDALTDEELSTIIDGPVSFILQNWKTFDLGLRGIIFEILDKIIKEKQLLTRDLKPYITFALIGKEELNLSARDGYFVRTANKIRGNVEFLPIFADNLKSNNKYVINQNLDDLEKYLQRRQKEETLNCFGADHNITTILDALLRTAQHFRTMDDSICEKCAKCISIIGCFDLTKNELTKEKSMNDEIFDFTDETNTIKFLVWVLNDILVPAFWQSENPSKQLFVALVMQESLKYCGLSSKVWDINKMDPMSNEGRLWNKFNTISKTTLYPLLSSLYLAQSWKEYVPLQYPSLTFKDGYRTWIKSLTLDLLKTGTEEEHPLHVFSSLIREDDGSLSKFLLPYIATDIIIKADPGSEYEKIMKNLVLEFTSIFTFDPVGLNHLQLDSLKSCYGTIFKVFEYGKKWITNFKQTYNIKNGSFIIKEEKYSKLAFS